MQIGILETGRPPGDLEARFGRYGGMFERLLGRGFDFRTYEVAEGELPEKPEDHPAYIVTGSPAGVYEDHPWIGQLKAFLQHAKGKTSLVGICFGHQIMAEAFGGRVMKYNDGWGIGLHRYEVKEVASWMDPVQSFAIPVSHQDQVVEQPPATSVVAASPFTRFAVLQYQDQPAISFQCHPEFEPEYAAALIESRRARLADPETAIASLGHPNDRALVGGWIRRFFEGSASAGV